MALFGGFTRTDTDDSDDPTKCGPHDYFRYYRKAFGLRGKFSTSDRAKITVTEACAGAGTGTWIGSASPTSCPGREDVRCRAAEIEDPPDGVCE